jgi:alpha-L-fucosidase
MATTDHLMDNAEAESRENRQQRINVQEQQDEAHERRIAWWREARVGLFIHWGLYSVPAGIWKGEEVKAAYAEHIQLRAQIPVKEYEQIAKQFNPVKFNAGEWVRTAKEAGLKYIVITAKHHDGFAMYDSAASDFNIVKATPFGRDPLRELAEACAAEGIRLCFYYSHAMDWHHPDSQGNTWDYPGNIGAYDPLESWIGDEDKKTRFERYLQQKAFPQVRELLTNYGPVGIMWFDCGHKITDEQGETFVNLVRSLQPDCLVNRRVRREGFGDYENSSDNQLHVRISRKDWESIATLNNSWGYKKTDHDWKSAKDIVRQMIDVASMNGNFLINVGPTGEGEFDPKSLELLSEIGRWLKENGESIYGTTGSPIGKPPWGRCTAKGNMLYLHVWHWPENGELIVPGVLNRVRRARLLAGERTSLPHGRLNAEDIRLEVPRQAPDDIASVIAVELEGDIAANPLKRLFATSYANVFGAFEGDIHGSRLRYDTGKKGRDNVTDWSDPADGISWRFRAAEQGSYRVEASYAVDGESAGGSFAVEIAGRTLSAVTRPTGGWYDFQPHDLGIVDIPAAGEYTLKVTAKQIPGAALMNLRHVALTGIES